MPDDSHFTLMLLAGLGTIVVCLILMSLSCGLI